MCHMKITIVHRRHHWWILQRGGEVWIWRVKTPQRKGGMHNG